MFHGMNKIRLSVIAVALGVAPFSQAFAATTVGGGLKGGGVSFALSVLSDVLANIIAGQLGIPEFDSKTSISETDFTSKNIHSAYGIVAYADGNIDKGGAASSIVGASWNQVVKATSTPYPKTFAELSTLADRGIFTDRICIGNDPCKGLTQVQTFPPGPVGTVRTVSAYGGFLFDNGKFIIVGHENSALVPVPEPSTWLLIAAGIATVSIWRLKRPSSTL